MSTYQYKINGWVNKCGEETLHPEEAELKYHFLSVGCL